HCCGAAPPVPRRRASCSQSGHTDHGVACDSGREFLFAEPVGPLRSLGEDEIAGLGRAVPHPDVDVVFELAAHLFQEGPRFSVHARATTLAPFIGPTSFSYAWFTASMKPSGTYPFSVSSSSRAATRRSIGEGGVGWCALIRVRGSCPRDRRSPWPRAGRRPRA